MILTSTTLIMFPIRQLSDRIIYIYWRAGKPRN